jgi:ectoine hydroxylase-related dioxygenase (phytanoyl-CoA dioxygenase family)
MLKNPLLQKSIEELGFTKVSLGDGSLTKALAALYQRFYHDLACASDMTTTHNSGNHSTSLEVHDGILEILTPYLNHAFQDFRPLACHFVIKKAKSEQSFQLHQDWNVVDERKDYNFQVWIPLALSYPENGGLCFVPRSHRFFSNLRSGSFGIPHIEIGENLHRYLSYLRLFPGEAGVFYSRTFHGSFMNSTPEDRVAILVNMVQSRSSTVYYHRSEQGTHVCPITTDLIYRHLHSLEKGELPEDIVPEATLPHQKFQNDSICAETLIDEARRANHKAGGQPDYENKLFSILIDGNVEREINHRGYAVIKLLDQEAMESLQAKFNSIFPDRTAFSGTFSTISATDNTVKQEAHEFILQTVKPYLDLHFHSYFCPVSLFYSRRPDNRFLLDWHNDPSLILNEHLEPLYGIWCPLVDVNNESGALKLIPGSHRLRNKLLLPYSIQKWPLDQLRPHLDGYAKTFDLKAGEAIIFDARMIHSSEPNRSTKDRDNIVMRINHCHSDYFNLIRPAPNAEFGHMYHQEVDFFFSDAIKHHNTVPNTGRPTGRMYLFDEEMTLEQISRRLGHPQ